MSTILGHSLQSSKEWTCSELCDLGTDISTLFIH